MSKQLILELVLEVNSDKNFCCPAVLNRERSKEDAQSDFDHFAHTPNQTHNYHLHRHHIIFFRAFQGKTALLPPVPLYVFIEFHLL